MGYGDVAATYLSLVLVFGGATVVMVLFDALRDWWHRWWRS